MISFHPDIEPRFFQDKDQIARLKENIHDSVKMNRCSYESCKRNTE